MNDKQADMLETFKVAQANCSMNLERLSEWVNEDHMDADPDNITWQDIGDAQRLFEQLLDICSWVFGEPQEV